jgi:predicted DNA-binding transcriptional regulator AlpA
MMDWLRKQIARELRNLANKFDANTTEISETQAMDIMSMLTHEVMSKEQACNYLNLSRSRFDDLVREGSIPRGRKRRGFKELVWYKDELQQVIK